MKVNAYRCDKCGEIKPEDEMRGIIDIEDLFVDYSRSFPSCDPDKGRAHHCLSCSAIVINQADSLCPRRKDERLYQLKFNELYYNLRHTCVLNVRNKKKFL